MNQYTSRDVPGVLPHTTLLFIDVQNYCAVRNGGEFKDLTPAEFDARLGWFFQQMETRVIGNMQRLQVGARAAGCDKNGSSPPNSILSAVSPPRSQEAKICRIYRRLRLSRQV